MSSPFANTLTVWNGLFLRECLDRFFGSRGAWGWLIFEPGLHIIIMGLLFSIFRTSSKGNTDTVLWLAVGMIAFFLFRRTAIQALHSVDCNKAFFAFRQVRPFDAALVRSSVEAFSMFFVAICLMSILAFFKGNVLPEDPLLLLGALCGLWLFGVGYGLITSVIQRLVPESSHILSLIMMPLYFGSFVIIPIEIVPPRYWHYILLNPIFHGIEISRDAFFSHYPVQPGTNLTYLYLWALALWVIGMGLYKIFDARLLTR